MAIEITRERFNQISQAERALVISEGAIIIDPEEQARQARIERGRAEAAAERKRRTIKRADFDKMTQAERDAHIKAGGLLTD